MPKRMPKTPGAGPGRWVNCATCKGKRTIKNSDGQKVTCPACNGAGGQHLSNI